MSEKSDLIARARGHLMADAIQWLAEWAGGNPAALLSHLPAGAGQAVQPYRDLLAGAWSPTPPGAPLLSIFALVQDGKAQRPPEPTYWRAERLSLKPAAPVTEAEARQADRQGLWGGFVAEAAKALTMPAAGPEPRFEAFTHLLHKWAWAVPCRYGEPGVSLYDEFRALSALVHASGCAPAPADGFLLVGGDVPGIQKTIYTITSRGAAKGLRGRSFFIQLLGDAVVRRLLDALDLPQTNVLYAAGGNFMVLAPAGAEETVGALGAEVNRQLLVTFEGDLSLCLACEFLPARSVGDPEFQAVSRRLHQRLGRQKRRRFADLAAHNWDQVFGPQGQGGSRFCAVCQHERQPGEAGAALPDGGWKCDQCRGFEDLAQAIAQDRLLLSVSAERPDGPAEPWQDLLWQLAGRWYDFTPTLRQGGSHGPQVYAINDLDFYRRSAHGFRLVANTTPRQDAGPIRSFEELADEAEGIKLVGVLRMDVDNLGRVLTQWPPGRTMAATSALSLALDRFFAGWLDAICEDVIADPQMAGVPPNRRDLLYVIYAGGDDLFVVGTWDLMPLLAERIQARFAAYTGHNPLVGISAGITLEDRRFPLYQAAARAGEALDGRAKELSRTVGGRRVNKNAISFLGMAVGWETYPRVKALAERLVWLTAEQGVPRSLLTTVRAIYERYCKDVGDARKRGLKGDQITYGPWMWRKVYQLARTRERYKRDGTEEVADAIKDLETRLLAGPEMPYVGLATRWAEYLTRRGEGK